MAGSPEWPAGHDTAQLSPSVLPAQPPASYPESSAGSSQGLGTHVGLVPSKLPSALHVKVSGPAPASNSKAPPHSAVQVSPVPVPLQSEVTPRPSGSWYSQGSGVQTGSAAPGCRKSKLPVSLQVITAASAPEYPVPQCAMQVSPSALPRQSEKIPGPSRPAAEIEASQAESRRAVLGASRRTDAAQEMGFSTAVIASGAPPSEALHSYFAGKPS
mmetsp:Transcript_124757/g.353163  ORF Transcript_124757/g.353163 Transcript_124757/m.353163 type:complete len:215 (-) Transcript_124757:240-884(-)